MSQRKHEMEVETAETVIKILDDVLGRLADMRPGDVMTLRALSHGVSVEWYPGLFRDMYVPLLALVDEDLLAEWAQENV